MANRIKEIIKAICKEQGITIAELARAIGVESIYLYGVLQGTKVSRPTILKLAEYLHRPDLLYEYEKSLRSRAVANQRKKTTPHKGGRP